MFTLEFDRTHNVLLTRFSGMLLPNDIRNLDQSVPLFVRDRGPVRRILDFSDVSTVAIPESFLGSRSRPTQIFLGQAHVFVVPQEELLALVPRYVRQQRDYGNLNPPSCRRLVKPTLS
jgi:hypothetical protein